MEDEAEEYKKQKDADREEAKGEFDKLKETYDEVAGEAKQWADRKKKAATQEEWLEANRAFEEANDRLMKQQSVYETGKRRFEDEDRMKTERDDKVKAEKAREDKKAAATKRKQDIAAKKEKQGETNEALTDKLAKLKEHEDAFAKMDESTQKGADGIAL